MEGDIALNRVLPFFPTSKIYKENEIIIEPKNNLYFRIDDIQNWMHFDCKMISWLSRSAYKGLSEYWQSYMRRGLNSYFRKPFSKKDWESIYTKFGNDCNKQMCFDFVQFGLDMYFLKHGKFEIEIEEGNK